MSLVFFETNLFVYWVEDHPSLARMVQRVWDRMQERADRLCTSALTIGELLAGPYSEGDEPLIRRYKALLRPPLLDILPFLPETADHYARIRARWRVRPADAVQLACAAQARVDLFLTNDKRLTLLSVPGIQFIADLTTTIL